MKIEEHVAQLQRELSGVADVRSPSQADAPILAPTVRAALFSWLREIDSSDELSAVGIKARTSALLYGPPGCGKTTLAHHVAARLGIPLAVTGPERIFDAYLGGSEKNVARLFDRLNASDIPCLLFFDEFESVGGNRSNYKDAGGGANSAIKSTITVLLRRVEEYRGYFIAATNRADDIDPAMWRRFGMQIAIDLPGEDERFAILRRYLAPFQLPDDDLDALATVTAGASPALLRELMEGVKRALVMGPKLKQDTSRPIPIFKQLIATAKPPPELVLPPLWGKESPISGLSSMSWPPTLPTKGD